MRDLLGLTGPHAEALPAEVGGNGFGNDANSLGFSRLLVEAYFTTGTKLAAQVAADAKVFQSVVGCAPAPATAEEESCANAFVARFGARAYRRPLEPAESERLLGVYKAVRLGGDFRTAATAVLRTVLQAPQFLYRIERGLPAAGDSKLRRADPYELATRLSYLLWGTMPDEPLAAAARSGRLATREEITAQTSRMLADPRARKTASHFHRVLFKLVGLEALAKDRTTYPKFVPGLGGLLAEEAERFADHVTWDGEGSFAALLTAPYTFMNADLARFYGVTGPRGAAFEKVVLDDRQRIGALTQGGLMALLTAGTQTNPVKRGHFIRERILCDSPPSPPATLTIEPPKPDPKLTTREVFAEHTNDVGCASCHRRLDPVGFAFETFDGLGLYRATDHGKPIETAGELEGSDVAGPFTNAVDLARRLSGSAQARRCYVTHWFEYGYGRGEVDADACTLAALETRFTEARGDVRALLLALATSDAFLYLSQGDGP